MLQFPKALAKTLKVGVLLANLCFGAYTIYYVLSPNMNTMALICFFTALTLFTFESKIVAQGIILLSLVGCIFACSLALGISVTMTWDDFLSACMLGGLSGIMIFATVDIFESGRVIPFNFASRQQATGILGSGLILAGVCGAIMYHHVMIHSMLFIRDTAVWYAVGVGCLTLLNYLSVRTRKTQDSLPPLP